MRTVLCALAAAVAFSFVTPAEAAVGIFDGSEITGVTGITVNGATCPTGMQAFRRFGVR